jgi:hypothetical protein
MPTINISITDRAHQNLLKHYQSTVDAAAAGTAPPSFDAWLLSRISGAEKSKAPAQDLNDIHAFNAIEKMMTSLHKHGFALACFPKAGVEPEISANLLASAMVKDLKLTPPYVKRLQDLFVHYQKGAREMADAAQVGITNRAYGAISEAFSQLVARTEKAEDSLSEERALGRVEGGIAILVGLDIMTRASAHKKTAEFKKRLLKPAVTKETWVNKVFRSAGDKR